MQIPRWLPNQYGSRMPASAMAAVTSISTIIVVSPQRW